MVKRTTAAALALSLLILCGSGTALAAAPDADLESSTTTGLSEYENNEVFVCYADGSFEVLAYEDAGALADGLSTLVEDQNVTLVQPNYAYQSAALSTSDALVDQQWALSNDGSFQMQEQKNRYPVYDSPFGTPFAPGRWKMPDGFGLPGGGQTAFGAHSTAVQSTAAAGIDINVEQAWELYDGGKREVVIALIDTGVDSSHEDLQDILWSNENEIPGNGIDDDGNGYVDDVNGWNFYNGNNRIYTNTSDDSHGTHAAGTIAASGDNGIGIAGIVQSENAKIMVLKALGGTDGGGTTASIIEAIRYAQANGASICNLSLGSSFNDRALYQAMAASTMLFVAAAGNDGENTDVSPCYPASYDLDNIISVANLNYDGTLHYSSNYGADSVDLAAPGSYILSTTPNNSYSYMTGTSMAAPMVSAAAAMLYSYHEDITLADVKEILLASARPLNSLTGSTATGGMLDLGAAMAYDVSGLSGAEWTVLSVDDGAAPEIKTQTVVENGRTYLTVQITDPDSDLRTTAYASGAWTVEQFHGGRVGQTFSLSGDGTARFSVGRSGTYTFYAVDSVGNETVETVSVTVETQSPTQPDGESRFWRSVKWFF